MQYLALVGVVWNRPATHATKDRLGDQGVRPRAGTPGKHQQFAAGGPGAASRALGKIVGDPDMHAYLVAASARCGAAATGSPRPLRGRIRVTRCRHSELCGESTLGKTR